MFETFCLRLFYCSDALLRCWDLAFILKWGLDFMNLFLKSRIVVRNILRIHKTFNYFSYSNACGIFSCSFSTVFVFLAQKNTTKCEKENK